jgi:hypothetical protein
MNHILHNIALIILCLGIILMTIYITKSNNVKNYNSLIRKYDRDYDDNKDQEQDIYVQKPGTIFKDMFVENSSWLNKYQSLDNSSQQNLYI